MEVLDTGVVGKVDTEVGQVVVLIAVAGVEAVDLEAVEAVAPDWAAQRH